MLFGYRCTRRDGTHRQGLLEAVNEEQARAELGSRGWTVLALAVTERPGRLSAPVQREKPPALPRFEKAPRPTAPVLAAGPVLALSLREVSLLTLQVSTLCGAGVPIYQAFAVVGQAGAPRMRLACEHLTRCLHEGARVSEALATMPRSFSPVVISLVRSGEESGKLVQILASLSSSLAQELQSYQRLAAALGYPIFALLGCSLLLGLLVGVMLPQVLPLLPRHGVLPWPTRLLLVLDVRVPLLVGTALVVLTGLASRTAEGALTLRQWAYRTPHLRRVLWARLTRNLALMLASGLTTTRALAALREPTCGSPEVDAALRDVQEHVENGLPLADALLAAPRVPPGLGRLLGASSEVGRPERFLESFAELAELQLEAERETFLTLLEPAMVLFMGIAVGFVVTAVFLPLYGSLT